MAGGKFSTLLASARRLVGGGAPDSADADLLERFATRRDETAFAALLGRHGPLVWSVCSRVLGDEHAAEDAFQATFLVLARRAGAVRKQACVRSWLHGVALRVALRARRQDQARRRRERATPGRGPGEAEWDDVRAVLDEEIRRLPEKYRLPVILCYLDGHTNDDAARLLQCPRGTVATRLARARERLRSQLERRGVTLSAAGLAAMLADNVRSASAPPALLALAARAVPAGAAPVSVTLLAEGVLRTMFLSRVSKSAATVLVLVAVGVIGAGAYRLHARAPASGSETQPKKPAEAAPDRPAPVAPAPVADTLATLMQQRLKLARQEVEVCERLHQNARVEFERLAAAWNDLMKAELELATVRADRIGVYERYIQTVESSVEILRDRHQAARVSMADVLKAQYLLVDARIALEREKARK